MEFINESIEPYDPATHIQTGQTLNRVSRKAIIHGSSNIILGGKCIIHQGATIRGDLKRAVAGTSTASTSGSAGQGQNLSAVTGRYCVIGEGAVLRPPSKTYKGVFSYYPIRLGDFVHIGCNTTTEAAAIGSLVEIGRDCVIGRFVTIKDCARVLDGSVVAPFTTIPSGQIWGGSPAKQVAELPETWAEYHENRCRDYYSRFRPATS